MFIDEAELKRRLEHPDNLCNKTSKDTWESSELVIPEVVPSDVTGEVRERYGKGTGVPVDPQFRTFLGLVAQKDTVKNVANEFGSNAVTVANARDGKNSNGKLVKEGETVLSVRERIADQLLDEMLAALPSVNANELRTIPKVKDRTAALKDLSQVHANLSPKQVQSHGSRIVIMSPGQGTENEFMTIQVETSVGA